MTLLTSPHNSLASASGMASPNQQETWKYSPRQYSPSVCLEARPRNTGPTALVVTHPLSGFPAVPPSCLLVKVMSTLHCHYPTCVSIFSVRLRAAQGLGLGHNKHVVCGDICDQWPCIHSESQGPDSGDQAISDPDWARTRQLFCLSTTHIYAFHWMPGTS